MKKITFVILMLVSAIAFSQNRVITTGVPFLLITSDARSAGMGEQGVATSPDAYSQNWNPSKYILRLINQDWELATRHI
jgi:hypothetical protein